MHLFHLGSKRYARQLTGDGARLFGGRWNQKGDACIYTSATRSLCILEYLANVSMEDLPTELEITVYELADRFCKVIDQADLPANWNEIPSPMSTKIFGSNLLADGRIVCFAVPSVIVPAELNYILNPAASNFKELAIVATEAFVVDSRIKK